MATLRVIEMAFLQLAVIQSFIPHNTDLFGSVAQYLYTKFWQEAILIKIKMIKSGELKRAFLQIKLRGFN